VNRIIIVTLVEGRTGPQTAEIVLQRTELAAITKEHPTMPLCEWAKACIEIGLEAMPPLDRPLSREEEEFRDLDEVHQELRQAEENQRERTHADAPPPFIPQG
jgi:hypothetical protein